MGSDKLTTMHIHAHRKILANGSTIIKTLRRAHQNQYVRAPPAAHTNLCPSCTRGVNPGCQIFSLAWRQQCMTHITKSIRKYSAAYCEYPSRILTYSPSILVRILRIHRVSLHIYSRICCVSCVFSRILHIRVFLRILRVFSHIRCVFAYGFGYMSPLYCAHISPFRPTMGIHGPPHGVLRTQWGAASLVSM